MQTVKLTRDSPYSAQQMFALVVDVDRYHEFIPYCRASRVLARDEERMCAELVIVYKRVVRETYVSEVAFKESPLGVVATQARTRQKKPFRHLYNEWQFLPREGGSQVVFELRFEFTVPLLRRVVQPMMARVVARFVDAFEARARAIYGAASQAGE